LTGEKVMTDPTTKAELLEAVFSSYNAFEKLLSSFTQEQLLVPGVNETWSIKDNVAHIAAWHQRSLAYLQAAARKRVPEHLPEALDEGGVDRVNEQFYQDNKNRSLNEVLQEFRTSYIEIVGAVQALSQEELFDPNRFAWMQGAPLWHIVAGNTSGHYQEHTEIIEAWLNASSAKRK
jgi:hypothetical protein